MSKNEQKEKCLLSSSRVEISQREDTKDKVGHVNKHQSHFKKCDMSYLFSAICFRLKSLLTWFSFHIIPRTVVLTNLVFVYIQNVFSCFFRSSFIRLTKVFGGKWKKWVFLEKKVRTKHKTRENKTKTAIFQHFCVLLFVSLFEKSVH